MAPRHRKLLFYAVVACSFLFFLPILANIVWHIRHGNRIVVSNVSFLVPFGWYARVENYTAYVEPFTWNVLSYSSATSFASFSPVTQPPRNAAETKYAYESFVTASWTLANSGEEIKGPAYRGTSERKAVCMETVLKRFQNRENVRCLVDNGRLLALFRGDPRYLPVFYRMVDDQL